MKWGNNLDFINYERNDPIFTGARRAYVAILDFSCFKLQYVSPNDGLWNIPEVNSNTRFPMVAMVDDVIKWKHFPRYWPFVRGIHRSPVNSTHKGQWREALMFSLICVWINGWENNREAGDLRRYRSHDDVIVMCLGLLIKSYSHETSPHGEAFKLLVHCEGGAPAIFWEAHYNSSLINCGEYHLCVNKILQSLTFSIWSLPPPYIIDSGCQSVGPHHACQTNNSVLTNDHITAPFCEIHDIIFCTERRARPSVPTVLIIYRVHSTRFIEKY